MLANNEHTNIENDYNNGKGTMINKAITLIYNTLLLLAVFGSNTAAIHHLSSSPFD